MSARASGWCGAVALALVRVSAGACGGGGGGALVDVSHVVDRGSRIPPPPPGAKPDPSPARSFSPLGDEPLPARGAVESIGPYAPAAGYWRVTLAGEGNADQRSFIVFSHDPPPFDKGQVLEVRRRRLQVGIHAWDECDELLDDKGVVLRMFFSGGTAPAGWRAEQVDHAGDGCRVLVDHEGVQTLIPSGQLRRIVTPDGTWDVTGKCPPPERSDERGVPDYVPAPLTVEAIHVVAPAGASGSGATK